MSDVTRREFIKSASGTAAMAVGAGIIASSCKAVGQREITAASASRVIGANETIRIACIGLNNRGGDHLRGFSRVKNVKIVALCDPDKSVLARRSRSLEKDGRGRPQAVRDMREIFDDPEIDAVSIATPNHWHSLATVWACQAGKDVYCEKPGSHDIFEGRQSAEAARKYARVVQIGAQSRSNPGMREGMQKLRDGAIGEVYMAKGICYKWRGPIGKVDVAQEPPKSIDYNLWQGPAPEQPIMRKRFHYDWHWLWDYGNGDLGNQGIHEMDKARWGLGVDWPTEIFATGAEFEVDDDRQTPNNLLVTFKFADPRKILVFEVRHWISNHEGGMGEGGSNSVGNIFYGSEGYMVMPNYHSYQIFLGKDREPQPRVSAGASHYANFIDAVRARDPNLLNAPVDEIRKSAALVHMANTAFRTGEMLKWDSGRERFTNSREANRMMKRKYRKPFVVPNRV